MKIAIIGIRGTGKSTLAKVLERRFRIQAVFADQYIWNQNWTLRDKDRARAEIIRELENKQDWIFEGNFAYVADYVFRNADMILYLDYSGITATIGCLKRWWQDTHVGVGATAIKPRRFELSYLIKKALLRGNRFKIEEAIRKYNPKILRRCANRKELLRSLTEFESSTISRTKVH